MCKCVNIEIGSKECYNQQILVDIPSHMASYREARIKDGLSGTIAIDPCIIDQIQHLWSLGIVTYGCCCGHNKFNSFVNVSDIDIQTMLDLGFIPEHWDETRKDTFILK